MARQMQRLFGRTICLYLADGKTLGRPTVFPSAPDAGTDTAPYITPGEQAVAEWVFRNNKHAGAGTDTLPGAKCLYLAVRSQDTVFAVAGIAMDLGGPLDVYDRNLLLAMLNEFALALERQQAAEARNRLFIQARQEQLRANLLRAVSHDLRTPLTSISGNASILMGGPELLDEKKKQQLYTDIYDDATWLISLVENLLTVTRIENGTMQLTLEPELIDEVAQGGAAPLKPPQRGAHRHARCPRRSSDGQNGPAAHRPGAHQSNGQRHKIYACGQQHCSERTAQRRNGSRGGR